MKAKRLSKAQRLSPDIITTLPQAIIETILCLLPIEEAARTSILSWEWRYKWTKIPKLVFCKSTVERSTKEKHLSKRKRASNLERAWGKMDMRCKLFYAIHQVLLLRQGPIHEFTLSMGDADCTCFEIDQIILHLSRNHPLKKLRLDFNEYGSDRLYGLPLSVFSLHHITDLYLKYCDIKLKPVFCGFGSLTRLTLNRISISTKALLHLLSNCPSLKRLRLMLEYNVVGYKEACIMELLKCLPAIEHLTIRSYIFMPLDLPSIPKEFPISLVHLTYISIKELGFGGVSGLIFLGVLTKCSPNLEKIKLEIETDDGYCELDSVKLEEHSVILEKYSDVWLEHLNELEIEYFRNYELEVVFVNFILARSPSLKKVILHPYLIWGDEELEMLKALFRAPRPPRASPVEIVIKSRVASKTLTRTIRSVNFVEN